MKHRDYSNENDADVQWLREAASYYALGSGSNKRLRAIADRLIAAEFDLVEALTEIAKGEGAFNHDPLIHAENTINNMKQIAAEAIAKVKGHIFMRSELVECLPNGDIIWRGEHYVRDAADAYIFRKNGS